MKANQPPSLHLTFDGQIWNLLYDPVEDVLAFEIRNNAKYNASYAAFDLKKNKFINKKIQPMERWWTSMLAVKKGNLVLYQYHDQQNPDLKDIFALDIKKGRQQWLHSELLLKNVEDDRLLVSKNQGDQLIPLRIDLATGNIDPIPEQNATGESQEKNIQQPFHYRENSDYFAAVSNFLQKSFRITPVKAMDYLEYEQYIIISYYKILAGNRLANELLVLNAEGEAILQESLSDDVKGAGMDTFTIINRQLIMIKDKSTLIGYKI